jgi:hypothetical protein
MFGATLRDTSKGCGQSGCHSSSPASGTSVTISSGTTAFEQGKTYLLTATVRNTSQVAAGINIATSFGALAPANDSLYAFEQELTHRAPLRLKNGSTSWTFRYTAPIDGLTDTIFATGNAVNLNGQNSGDQWNFAPKFVVHVSQAGVGDFRAERSPIAVFPNPVRDEHTTVSMELRVPGHLTLDVVDATGRTVRSTPQGVAEAGGHQFDVSTNGLAAGSYSLQARSSSGVVGAGRFVVIR